MNKLLTVIIIILSFSISYSQWEKISEINVGITGKMVTHNSTVFCYGDNGPNFLLRSTDNGSTWVDVAEHAPENFMDVYSFNGRLYTVWIEQIYVSDNLGDSWTLLSSVSIPGAIYGFNSDGSNLFAYTNGKLILKSIDGGITWQEILINDSRNITIRDFAVVGNIYVATVANIGAMISEDAGQTWSEINPTPSIIASSYSFNGTIYGSTFGGGIFRYNTVTKLWETSNSGIADNGSLQIPKSIFGTGNTVFTASLGLISGQVLYYSSIDNGAVWTPLNMDGIPLNNSTGSLDFITANSSYLFTFYYGLFDSQNRGIYRTPISGATSITESGLIPDDFALYQNYPNPFNPTTSIQYAIGNTQFVSLKVYDVLGNEIAELVNEEKFAGTYEINFSAAELSSGIYFYKLSTENFVQTKKMLLMK